jgi:hypothetical protein
MNQWNCTELYVHILMYISLVGSSIVVLSVAEGDAKGTPCLGAELSHLAVEENEYRDFVLTVRGWTQG